MNAGKISDDRLAVVGRMLSYYQEQGDNTSTALAKIRSHLPAGYANCIDAVERIINGDEAATRKKAESGALDAVARLATVIRQQKGDITRLFIGTRGSLRDAALQAGEYWSGFYAQIYYLITVLVIGIVIISVFSMFVLPHLAGVFAGVSADLPKFTEVVLKSGVGLYPLVIITAVLVSIYIGAAHKIKTNIARLSPLPRFAGWLPVIRKLNDSYGYFLFIQYAGVLTASGVSAGVAIEQAKELSGLGDNLPASLVPWRDAIGAAGQTEFLSAEIEHQSRQIGTLLNRQIIMVRESLTVGAQIFIGLLVGALVIAMYLPIFKLGSIV